MSMGSEAREDMLIASMLREQAIESNLANKRWQTYDGRLLKIEDMEADHIRNTLKWMDRVGFDYETEFKCLFKQELKRRT